MTEINPRDSVQDLINLMSVKKRAAPALIVKKLTDVYNSLEDVYSVSNASELQSSIDTVGTSAATLFLEAGTHAISTAIDVDGGGSLIIYGHGDQTILEVADGVSAFNITSCSSLTIKNLKIDCSNYSSDTQAILINEASDNVVIVDDVTIVGDGTNGIGIEIQSNNCRIENCNISSCNIGIHVNASTNNFIENNVVRSMSSQGLKITGGNYSTINANTLRSNLNGIYLTSSDNNYFSGNTIRLNTQNGVYLTGSDKNKFLGNVMDSNDSNTASSQAGIYLDADSNSNIIKDNTITDNNNSGAGTGYGLYIANSNCDDNIIIDNTFSGNDTRAKDLGTNSNITYDISTATDLQDAIDSIADKSGTITLSIGTLTLTQTIDVDGGGKYTIVGQGDTTILDINGDRTCFNITSAKYLHLKDIKIDASDLTTSTMEIIDVTEASNNKIFLENITISGDGTNGIGIEVNSENVSIKDCDIDNVNRGLSVLADNTSAISKNTITSCAGECVYLSSTSYNKVSNNSLTSSQYGIYADSSDQNTFTNNVIRLNTLNGIHLTGSDDNSIISNTIDANDSNTANAQSAIYIDSDSNSNIITSNTFSNNNNSGAGTGYGIYIANSNCDDSIVKGNTYSGNDVNWKDIGTNTQIEYICTTGQEIQDAIDSIAGKAGIIQLVLGTILLSASIDIDGNGDYLLEGQGDGTIIDIGADRTCFNVTSTNTLTLRNFQIDANDLTTVDKSIVFINEGSDNIINIEDLVITGDGTNGLGIDLESDNVSVNRCIINNVRDAIYIASDKNMISQNYLSSNDQRGINCGGNECTLVANICTSNDDAIRVSGEYNTITGNVFTGNTTYGLYTVSGNYNTISSNNFYSNGGDGIYLSNSDYCTITGNSMYDNNNGIILISGSDFNSIVGNNCVTNTLDGINLNGSSNNSISGNNCSGNDSNTANDQGGIVLAGNSDQNTISGNTCNNNNNAGAGDSYGINISAATCDENTVTGNTCLGNDTNYNDGGTNTFDSTATDGDPLNNVA